MQKDSKDLHVQPKSWDVHVIKIQGPGCFATRNPPVVIYVITGSSIWRVYNFQYFTKFFLEIIVKIIMLSLTWKEKFSIKMALEGLPHPQLSALPFVAADFHFVQREIGELHVELWFSFITFCWSQIRLLCLLFHLDGIPCSKSCWFPLPLWQNRNEIQVTIFPHWPRHIISSWGLHCPQV